MGTHKDLSGNTYTSAGNKPATSGSQVTVNTTNGPKQGTMVGGYVAVNKN